MRRAHESRPIRRHAGRLRAHTRRAGSVVIGARVAPTRRASKRCAGRASPAQPVRGRGRGGRRRGEGHGACFGCRHEGPPTPRAAAAERGPPASRCRVRARWSSRSPRPAPVTPISTSWTGPRASSRGACRSRSATRTPAGCTRSALASPAGAATPFLVYGPWGCGRCRPAGSAARMSCERARRSRCRRRPRARRRHGRVHARAEHAPADPARLARSGRGRAAHRRRPDPVPRDPHGARSAGARRLAVVIGVGGLGHMAVQLLSATTGARIVAVDTSLAASRRRARSAPRSRSSPTTAPPRRSRAIGWWCWWSR